MDIRITRRIRPRQIIDSMLAEHGSRQAVEAAAKQDPDSDANHALLYFQLADEDPPVLDEWTTDTVVWELEPHEIRLFTGTRIALLDAIAQTEGQSISALQRAVKRDYKRVQNDVDILERLGAVRTHREGRKRIVEARGTELTIRFA